MGKGAGKVFDMTFQLNAQIGGSYNNTFRSAQSAVAAMQREMQQLTRTQSDIAAFQKQQSAMEATRQKLVVLQQQYDNIQKEIKETGQYSSELQNKLLSKQQQIDKTTASLDRQSQKLGQMDTALREAGVDTGNLARESARLSTQMGDLTRRQEEAANGARGFGDASAEAFSAVHEAIAAAGIAVALKEIYDAYMECVTTAGDFEEAMSTVEALSGANAKEMTELSEKAKELGATTKFTAKQSADAMGYMGMAGWDAAEMLSGMDGVLQLAAASGEDLAMVSDIVTDNLSAFGLTAADTSHFADVLAAAATNANTNVAIMGETFKMSASIAGALGYSVEDVAVAVGLMANSGVKGSIAGTALKNTFNGLLEGVTLTSKAFGEYEYSAIKADGTMKGFGDTIDELRVYFDQMTEAERVNNAMTISGKRGYNGLLAILNATDEDYTSLTASINDCTGAAAKMASIKLDNMNGELTLAKSAWDALKMSVGEEFTPVMREVYAASADVFNLLSEHVKQNPGLIKAFTAFAAVLGTVVVALTAYTVAAKVATVVTAAIPGANLIMGVSVAVATITAGIVALSSASDEAVPSVEELTEAANAMAETMDAAQETYEDTVTSTMAAANVADNYISKLEQMEAAGINTDEQAREYHNTLALLCQTVPELADVIDLQSDTIEGGTAALRVNTEEWKRNAQAQAYQDYLAAQTQKYADVLLEAEQNSMGLTRANANLEAANKAQVDILAQMDTEWANAYKAAEAYNEKNGTWADATAFLSQKYYDLKDSLDGVNEDIRVAEGQIDSYTEAIEQDKTAVDEAKRTMELAEQAVKNLTGAMGDSAGLAVEEALKLGNLQVAVSDVYTEMGKLTEKYDEAYTAALTSMQGQYELWDQADTVVATSADSINAALQSQIGYWQEYNANLQNLGSRSSEIEGLGDMIASFADGSQESVNAIAGMAGASDEQLSAMVSNWQTLQAEQQTTAGSMADLEKDFTSAVQRMMEELAAKIEAMDLGTEAAEKARSTIQSYINAATGMIPQVQAAYARVGQAGVNALGASSGGGSVTVSPGRGYASGTLSAQEGWAWVGELGPELMYMHGGETVFPSDVSKEMAAAQTISAEEMQMVSFAPKLMQCLNAYQTSDASLAPQSAARVAASPIIINFTPQYNLSGATNAAELETVLKQHDDDLREYIVRVVEDAAVDANRRAYT